MKNLLIIGAGGHGIVLAETARETGIWEKIAFVDDKYPLISSISGGWTVLGKVDMAIHLVNHYCDVAVGIGDNVMRHCLLLKMKEAGFGLPVIVHPFAYISKSVTIEEGTVVFAQAAINARTQIGFGSIINTGATIDHDCQVEQGVHISPGAHIAGEVMIGEFSWVGLGASVINKITIGSNFLIGAGSVIIRNISAGAVIAGNPGRNLSGGNLSSEKRK